ncbi:hypothetical protein QAD02_010842 [Eretmocerus hayati]|uniref:Uncharacterized protein n=1 Tax=Eretmocerus hayati TaxID=131215 RepID=A0ACC2NWS6_9HYME|nr:hypothetical protein QAD02_010842 [Eretmocerus hayati]
MAVILFVALLLLENSSSARSFSFTTSNNSSKVEMDGAGDRNFDLNYADIVEAQQDSGVLIIDVREDSEIQETGKLPGSIHIPMAEVSSILSNLNDQEFEKKYNRKKPAHNTKIILTCRSGRRSAMVQSEIQKLGYNNAYNYAGGWLDWEEKQKV